MANAGSIRAYNIGLYSLLSSGNYVLTQAWSVVEKYFARNITVVISDLAKGDSNIVMKVPMVSQLRGINMTLEVGFEI
jgi:hypothetical protein